MPFSKPGITLGAQGPLRGAHERVAATSPRSNRSDPISLASLGEGLHPSRRKHLRVGPCYLIFLIAIFHTTVKIS